MSEPLTRETADLMALRFLRDNGPHTLGPIEDEGALAAAFVFLGLERAGLVSKLNFGKGYLQFCLTPTGLARAEDA